MNAGAQRSKEREAQLARKDDLTHFKPRKATTILVKVLSNKSHGNYSSPTILAYTAGVDDVYLLFRIGKSVYVSHINPLGEPLKQIFGKSWEFGGGGLTQSQLL